MPVREEYLALFGLLLDRSRANTRPIAPLGANPLHSHGTYGLYEVVAALGLINKGLLRETREGVIWAKDASTDVLFVTLEKSDAEYSATTRYQDYPLSPSLFHWESQNATSSTSETGRRYIEHRSRGSDVLLFVRSRRKDERGQNCAVLSAWDGRAMFVTNRNVR